MLTYQDLYEFVRKEKFGETLQPLPKKFVEQVSSYLKEKRAESSQEGDLFLDSVGEAKKQLENAIALFKELMLRRKKKILHLVFVAAETGIMKRDYEQMLEFEKEMFDGLVKAVEKGDKVMQDRLQGKGKDDVSKGSGLKMILFEQEAEEFVDAEGKSVGPFAAGELANLEGGVAAVLVEGGKASFVDAEG